MTTQPKDSQETQQSQRPAKRRVRRHRDFCRDYEFRLACLPPDKQALYWRLAERNGDAHTYS